MEIAPGIHLIPGTVDTHSLQLFLLLGSERRVLLDTGCAPDPVRLIVPYLATLRLKPTDIDLVINSHSDLDHCGGNAAWHRLSPRTLLTCGEADRALIEDPRVLYARRYDASAAEHGLSYDPASRDWIVQMLGDAQPIDFTWRGGGMRLSPDWSVEIRATPGHSPGHLAIWDPRSRTALTFDAVHGAGFQNPDGIRTGPPAYIDVPAYLRTIAALRTWGAELMAGCHWPVAHGPAEINAFLDETQAFVEQADRVLLAAVAQAGGGLSLGELMNAAGPHSGRWPRAADVELMYALSGNMARLESQGRALADRSVAPTRYRLPVAAPISRPTGRLQGKVAIVTGAGRGIGAAIAARLAEAGARVVVAELDSAAGEARAEKLRQAGGQAVAIQTDVGDPDSAERMVKAAVGHFGLPDVLINNAGVNVFYTPLDMPAEAWARCFRVDLEGAWNCCRAVLPHLLAKGGGSIVNIASVHAQQIIPHCFPYPVAKHGLLGLTRALAIEYAARNIRVNAICPGYIETELSVEYWNTFPDPQAERQRAYRLHPPQRIGRPDEVAWPALFLASDEAGFINGATLMVDGGRSVLYHGEQEGQSEP